MEINIEQLIADDIRDKVNKKQRERLLKEYYSNPNYCKYCNNIIIVRKQDNIYETKRKKFCDRQCMFNYNSENANPKYNMKCAICGKKINPENQSGLCPSCLKKKKDEEKNTKMERDRRYWLRSFDNA